MDGVDLTAPVRCSPRSRVVPLGDCLDDFRDDAVNLHVRGAVAGRCSRCSDGRQRRMLVAEGRMPLRAGEARPKPRPPATARPAPPAPFPRPDNDCDDGDNPFTVATPATPPAAPPTPTATATATPAPPTDALRDLAAAARELATAARELAGLLRAVGRLRLAAAEAPATTTTPAPTPAPPTDATTTATAPATPEPEPAPLGDHLDLVEALRRAGLSVSVRLDGAPARLLRAAVAKADGVLPIAELTSGAEAKVQQAFWTAARDLVRRGLLRLVYSGVYEVTPAGRDYAGRLARAAAAVGGAP